MVKFLEENGKYGIELGGKEIVPICHETKDNACEEWIYFETLNKENQFLEEVKTDEQIENLKTQLYEN